MNNNNQKNIDNCGIKIQTEGRLFYMAIDQVYFYCLIVCTKSKTFIDSESNIRLSNFIEDSGPCEYYEKQLILNDNESSKLCDGFI